MTECEFLDTFDAPALDTQRWLPYYLSHWSSRQRSHARFAVGDGLLRLRIEADQTPWCPEFYGDIRVSALQTGAFAGPVGSSIGQCHFRPDLVVREAQKNVRLYTPRYARVELRAQALADPRMMVALWMIGYEDEPTRSAEICICEIFGRDVQPDRSRQRAGVTCLPPEAHSLRDSPAAPLVRQAAEIKVVDADDVELQPGQVGEIVVHSP
jgi:hypothetical protein